MYTKSTLFNNQTNILSIFIHTAKILNSKIASSKITDIKNPLQLQADF
ncbi:Chaperone surA-Peptidyl-prolyl cis-trans isomerase surA-Rotamase surA [Moritella viscosa]|uniref:Chaperone surA-Peptidyl-prolyl cis-trans isomerase surA-Rotamase surA n=1 Tax=Moritella viscosa TaxID=80854 RepID=A0A1L0B0S9_9GAMM|nr:Chaperone surA-Peptidyl-prolyl cis-trans isomerase surA-Rotamase surA [Moritella viscosa]SHO01750.1 Chaperone surA-Peptidyl-prolyl cis-trans isomerase surA-Rotamase surA [Moritella viscosa]SHO20579.1 Chaperone surA-Peptidyl-prolyl cis-trans isomerase surA-Rotamase surA [Moritella viscosa]SHO24981.1 Chaperone surA-Peptidyl-prolyl cis-trans isomerase surA-Rotamase surA [Moritella viscosa]